MVIDLTESRARAARQRAPSRVSARVAATHVSAAAPKSAVAVR
jgi:hypothetical protein